MTTLKKVYSILKPAERKNALVLLGFMLVGMVLETLGIGLVIPAISLLTRPNIVDSYPFLQPAMEALGNPTQAQLVIGGMLLLVAVYLVKAAFLAFLVWQQSCFAFEVQAQLSQQLFATYLRQPYTFHLQRNSAQLIRNVTGEVNLFTNSALLSGMALITEGLVLLGIGGLLLMVEPVGALIVVLVLGCAAWVFHRYTRSHITRWGLARQFHEGLRLQHLQQGLGGVKDVKLLGRESDFLAQYRIHNTKSAHMGQFQATLLNFPRLWLELLAVSGMAMLVLSMVAQGRDMASITPTLGLFAIAAFRLMPSVSRVLSAIQSMRYGLPVINMLYEELKLCASEPALQKPNDVVPFQREIRLVNISYKYPCAPVPTLKDLGITIQKGESVGFIGPSGSGKSTLVDVILGLLVPSGGEIMIDGRDVQQSIRHWQDQIGYVPQSIYLTDDTIRRNVAFGVPNEQIDDDSVRRAITDAQLEDFITNLPDGLETMVGERGIRLSGGQRQRIGIARALYHDPSVLVLDEATSALDADTEKSVMQAVTALQHRKTIMIIAHRLTTLQNCNKIYSMDNGMIVASGSYQELCSASMTSFDKKDVSYVG